MFWYIATKAKKANLESNIAKTKEKTRDHEISREKIKVELVDKRTETIDKMKSQNEELKALENEILETGLKLHSVYRHNNIFVDSIHKFEENYKNMDTITIDALQNRDTLVDECDRLHRK